MGAYLYKTVVIELMSSKQVFDSIDMPKFITKLFDNFISDKIEHQNNE